MPSRLHSLYTVRNRQGQLIATYYAKDAKAAIARLINDQAASAQTFKKSQPMTVNAADFSASVETPAAERRAGC